MNEVLPILYGTLAGLCCARIRAAHWRTALWIVLSVLGGVAATLLSGEFKFGWGFLFIDIPLAGGVALGVITLRKFARPASTVR